MPNTSTPTLFIEDSLVYLKWKLYTKKKVMKIRYFDIYFPWYFIVLFFISKENQILTFFRIRLAPDCNTLNTAALVVVTDFTFAQPWTMLLTGTSSMGRAPAMVLFHEAHGSPQAPGNIFMEFKLISCWKPRICCLFRGFLCTRQKRAKFMVGGGRAMGNWWK